MSQDEYITRIKKYAHYGKYFDIKHTEGIVNYKRKENKYKKDGKTLVSVVKSSKSLKNNIKKSIDLIGGLKKSFKKNEDVLLVPNFNSDDPYPATTDLKFLEDVIKIFQEYGIKNITIGASCGVHWLPTRNVLGKLKVLKLADKLKVKVVCFEEEDWVRVKIKSDILRDLSYSKEIFKHDKIVYLPCLKSHRRARFTSAIKLTMALLCIKHRVKFIHVKGIEEKLADLNKAVYPDLIITDARKVFITGGPDKGQEANLDLILASGDRAAIDLVGLNYLLKFPKDKRDPLLDKDIPEEYGQIKRAMKIKLGIKNKDEIKVVE